MSYIGHEDAWSAWHTALAGPRMHHGWILAGRRGIGKMGFALAAARELVCEEGIPQPSGDHPDIHVLTHLPRDEKEEKKREEGKPYELKRSIGVAQIRAMQQRLTTRPTLGSRRVIVIDPADDLEKSAANALLKSLEEPPPGTYFLLVAHRLGRLLPTIRSRCRILRFPDLDDAEIARILAREAPQADEQTRRAALVAAKGSPGVALDFVELGLGPAYGLMQRLVRDGDPDFVLRGALAAAAGTRPSREFQLAAIELALSVVAEAMREARRAALPAIIGAHEELGQLTAQAPTYNFDSGLLMMEIGSLLANAAGLREPAHG